MSTPETAAWEELNRVYCLRLTRKYVVLRTRTTRALDRYHRAKSLRRRKMWDRTQCRLASRCAAEFERICGHSFNPFHGPATDDGDMDI